MAHLVNCSKPQTPSPKPQASARIFRKSTKQQPTMHCASPLQVSAAARRWVIALLVIAFAWCGLASTLAQVQGARHVHKTPAATRHELPTELAQNFSDQFKAVFKTPSRPVFVHAQQKASAHFHDASQRHHHDVADNSVVYEDPFSAFEAVRAELDASAAKAVSLLWQPAALLGGQPCATISAARAPWCETPLWQPTTTELCGLRRPPKSAV
jgi:hypothetical protein